MNIPTKILPGFNQPSDIDPVNGIFGFVIENETGRRKVWFDLWLSGGAWVYSMYIKGPDHVMCAGYARFGSFDLAYKFAWEKLKSWVYDDNNLFNDNFRVISTIPYRHLRSHGLRTLTEEA